MDDGENVGRRRSKSFIVEDDEDEVDGSDLGTAELSPDDAAFYGRSRGTSFAVSAEESASPAEDDNGGGGRSRGTSFAISADEDSSQSYGRSRGTSFAVDKGEDGGTGDDVIRRAANLSKISMRGGVAVGGVDFVPTPKEGGQLQVLGTKLRASCSYRNS